ncbi:MAG: hypothetical protein J0I36_13270, partial [Pandoraea sp.]|nr:hypothetical protein [Pandoraea sp.]
MEKPRAFAVTSVRCDRGDLCLNTRHRVIACYPNFSQNDNSGGQESTHLRANFDKSLSIAKRRTSVLKEVQSKEGQGSTRTSVASGVVVAVRIGPTAARVFPTSRADVIIQRFHKARGAPAYADRDGDATRRGRPDAQRICAARRRKRDAGRVSAPQSFHLHAREFRSCGRVGQIQVGQRLHQ